MNLSSAGLSQFLEQLDSREQGRSDHQAGDHVSGEGGKRLEQVMYRIDIMYKHATTDQEHGDGADNTQ